MEGIKRFEDDYVYGEGRVIGNCYGSKINGGRVYTVIGLEVDQFFGKEFRETVLVKFDGVNKEVKIQLKECMLDKRVL